MSFLNQEIVLPAEDDLASDVSGSNSSEDSDLPDLLSNPEELALFNRLLELPSFWNMLAESPITGFSSFDQGPDGNSICPNVDLNLNFGQYGQDFSQYNDMQFNHLVNESQTPQPGPQPQDSPSHMVQVKTEDEP